MMESTTTLPEDVTVAVAFHGHLCPGLAYGILVARAAFAHFGVGRCDDEQLVAVCETDACTVDALQILLGTTLGKGNLLVRHMGKNAYTIFDRSKGQGIRFVKKDGYTYQGPDPDRWHLLIEEPEKNFASLKRMKAIDLLFREPGDIFATTQPEIPLPDPAVMAISQPCTGCNEQVMAEMLLPMEGGQYCVQCARTRMMAVA